jgi:hypothetical protein
VKHKLKIFSDFSKGLLPLEVDYLTHIEKFEDPVHRKILQSIQSYNKSGILTLPTDVDKRKYSYLKKWISNKLDAIDVDLALSKLCDLDKKVLTDSLMPEDEKALVRLVKRQLSLPYYFMRMYELAKNYHSFLLIRIRYHNLQIIEDYLKKYESAYNHSRQISDKLHKATKDIIDQYSFLKSGSRQWEDFLKDVFYDETLDGLNRYNAIVRLTFLYYNYNELDKIVSLYDYLDSQITGGGFYSRRILLNYYSNRVILHAKLNDMDRAEYFGHLSLRGKGSDYIHYLNVLVSVLLRQNKNKLALEMMQESIPELRKTISFHNRVGFAALLIRCFNANNKPAEGESYASTFFRAYRGQIMMYRWHTFFSAYIQSLVMQEKYREVLSLCNRQNILTRELDYQSRGYLPIISWYYQLSLYKTGKTDLKSFRQYINLSEKKFIDNPNLMDIKSELINHVPDLF